MFFEEEEEGKESFVAGTVLRNTTAKELCKVSFILWDQNRKKLKNIHKLKKKITISVISTACTECKVETTLI